MISFHLHRGPMLVTVLIAAFAATAGPAFGQAGVASDTIRAGRFDEFRAETVAVWA